MINEKIITIIWHNNYNGLLEVISNNWSGRIFKIPRSIVNNYDNNDLNCPGVYFLICKNINDLDSIYIGETENILNRLNQHIQDYEKNKKNYYWNYAFVLIGNDLDKATSRYMETKFVKYFKESNMYKVLTKSTINDPKLSNYRKISSDEYINTSIIILETLGLSLMEKKLSIFDKNNDYSNKSNEEILVNNKTINDFSSTISSLNTNKNDFISKKIYMRERIIQDDKEWYKYCRSKKSIFKKNKKFDVKIIYNVLKLRFVNKLPDKKIASKLYLNDYNGFVINVIVNFLYTIKENHDKKFDKKIYLQ